MVKSGEIAATVLIAGKPTGSFAKFKLEPGMTLLPVPYTEVLEQDYFPAKLTSEDYPALIPKGTSVDTVAVASVLAVYNWPRDTDRYRRVATLHRRILHQVRRVPEAGAASEMEGDQPQLDPEGVEAFSGCRGMAAAQREAGRPAGRMPDPALARAQAAKAAPNSPEEQQRLFQQFMEWAKTQGKN